MEYKSFIIIFVLITYCFGESSFYDGRLFEDGKDARISAMAGVSHSIFDLSNCILENQSSPTIDFSYKSKFDNLVKINSFSILLPNNNKPILLKLTNRLIDEIYDTRSAWDDDGDFIPESGEIDYFKIDQIQQQEIGISISTIKLLETYMLGFSFKPNFIKLAEYSAYGASFDISAMKQLSNSLNIMMSIENIYAFKYWNSGSFEKFSPIINGGMFYKGTIVNGGIYLERDIKNPNYYQHHLGVEMIKDDKFFFRLGHSYKHSLSIGFGIKTYVMNIDYAYIYLIENNLPAFNQILSFKIILEDLIFLKGKIKP